MHRERIYKLTLLVLMVIYILLFFWLAQLRYQSFFSYEWEDQAENNRLCWSISHGKFADLCNDIMPAGKYYKVHAVYIFLIISFLYKLYPHIQTLFFIITSSLAISAIPIYLIASRLLKNGLLAFLLAVAYLFYAPKHALNFLDSDPIIFIIPLLLFAFYAALTAKNKWLYFIMALVLICKTESPIFVAMFAVYLYIQRKQLPLKTKTSLILFSSGVILFLLNIYISQKYSSSPLFNGFYTGSFLGAFGFVLEHPLKFLFSIFDKKIFMLFWPVLFLPILSLELYIGLPSIALILLTQYFVFQRAHYISGIIPFIFIGTIYVIRKFSLHFRLQLALVLLILLACVISNFANNVVGSAYPPEAGIIKDTRFVTANNIFDKRFYTVDDDDRIAWNLIKMIPNNASVAASGDLLVPLSSREKVFEFLSGIHDYYNVDYILLHNKNCYIGAGHYEWDNKRMEKELNFLLKSKDWVLLAHEKEFFLFEKIK